MILEPKPRLEVIGVIRSGFGRKDIKRLKVFYPCSNHEGRMLPQDLERALEAHLVELRNPKWRRQFPAPENTKEPGSSKKVQVADAKLNLERLSFTVQLNVGRWFAENGAVLGESWPDKVKIGFLTMQEVIAEREKKKKK